jgi:trigger factor
MAELADALDLGSSTARCGGSSPPFRTNYFYFKLKTVRLNLESKVNVISDSEHEISVKLDYDEIKKDIDDAYLKERRNISLPGFRKGKVPLQMVKKIYGDAIEYRASEDIANKKFWDIVKSDDLKPISTPKLTDINYDKGKELKFTIRYEVMPEIEPKDYKGLEIEKPVFKVKEEDIEKELKDILRKEASFEEAEKVEDEDFKITVDLQLLDKNGEVNNESEKQKDIEIALNNPGIKSNVAEKALGKKVGDTFDFIYTYEIEKGNYIDLKYLAEIKKIEKFVFPEWSEELCKKVSDGKAKNLEELKQFFRDEYNNIYNAESEKIYVDSLLSKIMKNNDIVLPKEFTEKYLEDLTDRELENAKRKNYKIPNRKDLKEELRHIAEWHVKWEILSNAIAKAESIEVTDEDLRKLAEEESSKTNISVEKLVKYYKESNKKTAVLEEKVIDFLKENNPPKEIDAEEIKKREEAKKEAKEKETKEGNKK